MLTVYYDGKCGLCSKEINYYKTIAPPACFIWIDITQEPEKIISKGFKLSDGLEQLHVKDENHHFYKGIDSFIMIWRKLPYWKYLAIIASLPIIKQLASLCYTIFAKWRFKRLKHCQAALNEN